MSKKKTSSTTDTITISPSSTSPQGGIWSTGATGTPSTYSWGGPITIGTTTTGNYYGTPTTTGAGTGPSYTINSSGTMYNPSTLKISGTNPKIATDNNEISIDEMIETIKTLQERMLILTPMFELHEKYPALKEAYNNYKMIESMLSHAEHDK